MICSSVDLSLTYAGLHVTIVSPNKNPRLTEGIADNIQNDHVAGTFVDDSTLLLSQNLNGFHMGDAAKKRHFPEMALLARLLFESAVAARRKLRFADYDEMMIAVVAMWGEAEGMPLDSSKIAEILDLPRTTVNRKLERLVDRGEFASRMNGRRKLYYNLAHGTDERYWGALLELLESHKRQVSQTMRNLSKLDR